jgi:hypothetical protein
MRPPSPSSQGRDEEAQAVDDDRHRAPGSSIRRPRPRPRPRPRGDGVHFKCRIRIRHRRPPAAGNDSPEPPPQPAPEIAGLTVHLRIELGRCERRLPRRVRERRGLRSRSVLLPLHGMHPGRWVKLDQLHRNDNDNDDRSRCYGLRGGAIELPGILRRPDLDGRGGAVPDHRCVFWHGTTESRAVVHRVSPRPPQRTNDARTIRSTRTDAQYAAESERQLLRIWIRIGKQ